LAKKNRGEESGGNWMDTYGDLVTLLLTFFVMLYSMASVAEDKWSQLVKAFNNRFGHEQVDQIVIVNDMISQGEDPLENMDSGLNMGPENDSGASKEMDKLFMMISEYVEKNDMQDSIAVALGDEQEEKEQQDESSTPLNNVGDSNKNIYIQFKNDVLFNPDESSLKKGSDKIVGFLGETLKEVDDQIAMIIIKGHTAIATNSNKDSRLLSSERAGTISNFLERKYDLASTKLYPIGLGEDYPLASNDTEEGRTKNRRVEIVIIGKNSNLVKSGELLKILGKSFSQGAGDIKDIASN
jgi:chemotaxis protein MotB